MAPPKRRVKIDNVPVPLFDNESGDSTSFELLTISEVAKFLKISVSGVRRLQQGRQISFTKIGGSIRFNKSDILSYLDKRRVEALG